MDDEWSDFVRDGASLDESPAGRAVGTLEARFRQIFETVPAPLAFCNRDGSSLQVNRSFVAAFGYTQEEIPTRDEFLRRAYPDAEYRRWVEEDVARAVSAAPNQGLRSSPRRITGKDGRVRTGVLSTTALEDIVLIAFTDLTQLQRAEQTLKESEQSYRLLAENATDVTWVIDVETQRCRYVSPSVERQRGFTAEEVTGQALSSILTPASMRRIAVLLPERVELFRRGVRTTFVDELEQPRRDGTIMLVEATSRLVVNPQTGRLEIQGSSRDITDRRRAEEERRRSETRLQGILDNLQDAFMQTDESGRYNMVSPSAPRMYGYASAEEMIGLAAAGLYADPSEREQVLEELRRTGRVSDRVLLARRKDGTTFWISLNAVFYRDDNGRIAGTRGVVRDISDRKRAEEEQQELHAKLAQSDRLASMGILAAGVAHEINNPLTYVLYNLKSLAQELPDRAGRIARARRRLVDRLGEARLREILGDDLDALDDAFWTDAAARFDDAVDGGRRIKEIVGGLGAFSRVDQVRPGPVDPGRAIDSALNISFNEIRYRAQVHKELNPTAPVLATEGKLSQVFLNLLVNAAHAIGEGDAEHNMIRLRTWQEGDAVLAEVADTGCGMSSEVQKRIFDPFFSTKPIGLGSGLGLFITRAIVTGFGGSITFESEVGRGTRFVVRLPAAAGEMPVAAPGLARAEVAAGVHGRMLVVDDEAAIRRILRRILAEHDVVEAESGERALAVLSNDQQFDVILCDLMMPQVSGIEVHRWLAEHHPALAERLVFVSGGAFTPAASEYLQGVSNLRVAKPFESAVLRELLAKRIADIRAGGRPG